MDDLLPCSCCSYLVFAGLVFVTLSQPYMQHQYGKDWARKAPIRLCDRVLYGILEKPGQEVILLSQVNRPLASNKQTFLEDFFCRSWLFLNQNRSIVRHIIIYSLTISSLVSDAGIALPIFALIPGTPWWSCWFRVTRSFEGVPLNWIYESKFLYLRPRDALQIQKCIFWEALCLKMHDFCVSAIPEMLELTYPVTLSINFVIKVMEYHIKL